MLQRLLADRSVRTKIMSVVMVVSLVAAVVAVLAVSRLAAEYGTAQDLITGSLDPMRQLS